MLEIRKDLVQETARAVREVHARRIDAPGFNPWASFLFAGCASDGPFILEVHPDLTDTNHIGTGYSAIGSGDIFPYYAMASLTHYTVRDRTLMEAKLIACRILQDAINTAAFGLGLPISMVEVHGPEAPGACGTAQRLSADDVRAVQDKILEWKAVETETLSELLGLTVVPEAGPVEDEPEEAEPPTPAHLPQP